MNNAAPRLLVYRAGLMHMYRRMLFITIFLILGNATWFDSHPAQATIRRDDSPIATVFRAPDRDQVDEDQGQFVSNDLFTLAWQPVGGQRIYGASWGDIDADGYLDLLIRMNNALHLYHNTNGLLDANPLWSLDQPQWSGSLYSIKFLDVDNNNYPDILVLDSDSIDVFKNVNGHFNSTPSFSIIDNYNYGSSMEIIDMNGDGFLDVLMRNSYGYKIYHNNHNILVSTPKWILPYNQSMDEGYDGGIGDINQDGLIDFILCSDRLYVYINQQGNLPTTASWMSDVFVTDNPSSSNCNSIDIIDINADNQLDVYVLITNPDGDRYYLSSLLYRNTSGTLTLDTSVTPWLHSGRTPYQWGDVDGDNDPDLIVAGGTDNGPPFGGCAYSLNRLYLNTNGSLSESWASTEANYGSPGFIDIDSDNDLDLVIVAGGDCDGNPQYSHVYQNNNGNLDENAVWSSHIENESFIQWADINNDTGLEIISSTGLYFNHNGPSFSNQTGNNSLQGTPLLVDVNGDNYADIFTRNTLHLNNNGSFSQSQVLSGANPTAFGDIDQDKDLDLVSTGTSTSIYRNTNGLFTVNPIWTTTETSTHAVFGDVDQDGDLDLIATGKSLRLYQNNNGLFTDSSIWSVAVKSNYAAFGDIDQDSDLDLMVVTGMHDVHNGQSLSLYRNDNGILTNNPVWSVIEQSTNIAWGDIDIDGDLDLISNGNFLHLYQNDNGILKRTPIWSPLDHNLGFYSKEFRVELVDVDNDGDLDLSDGRKLYINMRGTLDTLGHNITYETDFGGSTSPSWGNIDGDGDIDYAYFYYSPLFTEFFRISLNKRSSTTHSGAIPTISIHQPHAATPYYGTSLIWSSPTRTFTYTLQHPASQRVQRIVGQYSLDGGGHWSSARPSTSTQLTNLASSPTGVVHTFTWDIFGSGVMGQSDNVVFRLIALPSTQTSSQNTFNGFRYGSVASTTLPFRLRGNQIRVLQGTTPVVGASVWHQAIAQTGQLHPYADLTGTPYRTNSQGYLQGRGQITTGDRLVALTPISQTEQLSRYSTSAAPTSTGIAAFTVTSPGVQTLTTSTSYSLTLFNLDVSLEWDARHDPIYLQQLQDNFVRVSEILYDWSNGQIALGRVTIYHTREHWNDAHVRIYATNRLRPNAAQGGIITEPISDPLKLDLAYTPGQIHMGSIWNRYGDATSGVSDDWARTLAHEFGHYGLFLNDNYLGLDQQGQLITVETCPGAMSDPYRQDWYSEFHPDTGWLPACAQTLSQQEVGRSDWRTITTFYPWITPPSTAIQQINSGPSQLPLAVTDVRMVDSSTPSTALDTPIFFTVNADGSRYLSSRTARAILVQSNRLIDLGQPTLDQIIARGAQLGDRLCLYDVAAGRMGCETIQSQDEQLTIHTQAHWQPEVVITPVTSTTLKIRVGNVPSGLTLQARVFSSDTAPSGPMALLPVTGGYERSITLTEPTVEGHVQIWVNEPEPRREIVAQYAVGGNPGYRRVRVGYRRVRVAPILSPDGQALLFSDELTLEESQIYILQAATALPDVLPWASEVGNGYWLSASPSAPPLTNTSISISYLGTDVPAGEEQWIRMYFWNGIEWQKLPTTLDTYNNTAVADTQGPGLYLLMSSIEVSLPQAGWNLVAYPVAISRPITDVLLSINGAYTIVYGFDNTDTTNPWKMYAPHLPTWVPDLTTFEFGKGYWIYATQPITLYLKGASSLARSVTAMPTASLFPPAVYYGEVWSTSTMTPIEGMTVRAVIDGQVCGQTQTQRRSGTIVYILKVDAQDPLSTRCGRYDDPMTITIDGVPISTSVTWDNRRAWYWPLGNAPRRLYLPLLRR